MDPKKIASILSENAKLKRERQTAIILVFLFEIGMASAVTALAAAILLPLAYAERGYYAIGGDWACLFIIVVASFTMINNAVFRAAKRGAKKSGRDKNARRKVSGSRNQLRVIRGGAATGDAQAQMDYQQRG